MYRSSLIQTIVLSFLPLPLHTGPSSRNNLQPDEATGSDYEKVAEAAAASTGFDTSDEEEFEIL